MDRRSADQKKTIHTRKAIPGRLAAVSMAAFLILLCTGCVNISLKPAADLSAAAPEFSGDSSDVPQIHASTLKAKDIEEYSGSPYAVVNDNIPDFSESDLTEQSFEKYSRLDKLGRCGEACTCVGRDLMPTEERGEIGHIKPSGWQFAKYDFVDGKYLYNRCHLIGYQLTAENDNERNLITGTRYMNTEGMLPFENEVADYVRDTNNHVMFRVTPIYKGAELVARGVEMEALSVEDGGAGVCYHIFAYNCQPGVTIDYLTGENWPSGDAPEPAAADSRSLGSVPQADVTYILNTRSGKFHKPSCPGAEKIASYNRQEYSGTREELIQKGFQPCGMCTP